MRVCISARTDSPRTASLLRWRDLADALVDWTAALAADCLGASQVEVLDGCPAGSQAPSTVPCDLACEALDGRVDWVEFLAALGVAGEPLVVVSPFDGVLSRRRLEDFAARLAARPGPAEVRSALRVGSNMNPLWLKALPREDLRRDEGLHDWGSVNTSCLQRVVQEGGGFFPAQDVLGSQHLPDLYIEDDVLAGVAGPGWAGGERLRALFDPDADEGLPLLYRFNLHYFHAGQSLELSDAFAFAMREALRRDTPAAQGVVNA